MNAPVVATALVSLTLAFHPICFADDELPLPPGESSLTAIAEQLVDALATEDFASATEHFDIAMKRTFPETRLRELWHSLTQQVGPFQQRLAARTEQQAGFEVVFVTCEFRDFVLEAKVLFNPSGQVAGLLFAAPTKSGTDT